MIAAMCPWLSGLEILIPASTEIWAGVGPSESSGSFGSSHAVYGVHGCTTYAMPSSVCPW